MKSEKENIFESFRDRRSILIMGLFCLAYFVFFYFVPGAFVAKILPPWRLRHLAVIGMFVLAFQLLSWKLLRHFQKKWYKHAAVWVLFSCEFFLMLFSLTLLTWPVWLFLDYLSKPHIQ